MRVLSYLSVVLVIMLTCNCLLNAKVQDGEQIQAESKKLVAFGFEGVEVGELPHEWSAKGMPGFSATVSDADASTGKQCLKLVCQGENPPKQPVGGTKYSLDMDGVSGKRIRFRASVNADVGDSGEIKLWLREDLQSGEVGAFDHMAKRPITLNEWKQYEIVADISTKAKAIELGILMAGKGEAFIDDIVVEFVDDASESTAGQGVQEFGMDSSPGLFEINGSMKVQRIESQQADREVRLLLPLPLVHDSQYPLTYNLTTDPPQALKSVRLYEDKPKNFVAEVVLNRIARDNQVDINFNSAVMVLPSSFENVPKTVAVLQEWPEEATPWLTASWCVDSDNERIKAIASEIRSETDDVMEIIGEAEIRAKEIFGAASGQAEELTAVQALDRRGSCTSCGNLVAALLRASDVPARVLAGYPAWSGPLQTHYIVEAYVPGYGWYPIESTMCKSPWPNKNQINVSIISPEYEAEELAGWRTGVAGGVPYLSLTEIADNNGEYVTIGTIPNKPFCDHECKFIRGFENSDADWNSAAEWASKRWKNWLHSDLEVANGKVEFGMLASEIRSETASDLVEEIRSEN